MPSKDPRRSRTISSRRSARDELAEGEVLRLGIIQEGEKAPDRPRQPLCRTTAHVLTAAVNDKGELRQPGSEPPAARRHRHRLRGRRRARSPTPGDLPRVYDGIYRASLSYGLSKEMTARLIRLLASTVDFQARLQADRYARGLLSPWRTPTARRPRIPNCSMCSARFGDNETPALPLPEPG